MFKKEKKFNINNYTLDGSTIYVILEPETGGNRYKVSMSVDVFKLKPTSVFERIINLFSFTRKQSKIVTRFKFTIYDTQHSNIALEINNIVLNDIIQRSDISRVLLAIFGKQITNLLSFDTEKLKDIANMTTEIINESTPAHKYCKTHNIILRKFKTMHVQDYSYSLKFYRHSSAPEKDVVILFKDINDIQTFISNTRLIITKNLVDLHSQ